MITYFAVLIGVEILKCLIEPSWHMKKRVRRFVWGKVAAAAFALTFTQVARTQFNCKPALRAAVGFEVEANEVPAEF